MAIICTKDVNTNLSTANGFWRVEAARLGTTDNATRIALSATRTINVTFANAGNLKKVGLCFADASQHTTSASGHRTVTVELKESGVTRASVSVTGADLYNNVNYSNVDLTIPTSDGLWYTFEGFNYAVTTAVGVWTLVITNAAGSGTRDNSLRSDNGLESGICYFAVCDNTVTASSGNDCVIADKIVTIDQSFIFQGVLTGNSTANSICAIACSSKEALSVNYPRFVIDSPAAPIAITIRGYFILSQNGGMRFGTAANPIPVSSKVTVTIVAATAGTAANSQIVPAYFASGASASKMVFEMYGAFRSKKSATLASNSAVGTNTIVTTEDLSSIWQAGDEIVIGGQGTASGIGITVGTGWDTTKYVISSISGTTITLTTNLATYIRYATGKVINLSGDGIEFTQTVNTGAPVVLILQAASRNISSGVHYRGVILGSGGNAGPSGWYSGEVPSNRSKIIIQDCNFSNTTTSTHMTLFSPAGALPYEGLSVKRINIFWGNVGSGASLNVIASKFLEEVTYEDIVVLYVSSFLTFSTDSLKKPTIKRLYIERTPSGNSAMFTLATANMVVEDCEFLNHNSGTYAFMGINNGFNCVVRRCKFNGVHTNSYAIRARGNCYNLMFDSCEFGQLSTVTYAAGIESGWFAQMEFKNCKGNFTTDANTINAADGSMMNIVNNNQTANFDLNYLQRGNIVRCGDGLSDTTKRNGTDCMRFQSLQTLPLEYSQNIPTGNIQGKTMVLGTWIKINSANYWSGTNQMPRLTVTYDDGVASAYAEAAQIAGDWQFIFVPITPTTTFGQVKATLSCQTAATGADSYVYFDDFTAPLPQGSELNLGGMDTWADGFPIAPMSLASAISAADVWAADPTKFGASTVGDKVNKIKTDTGLIPALL